MKLVARVDEQRLAAALARVPADGLQPAAQPVGAAQGIGRPGGERARTRRGEKSAVHVVDPDDDKALEPGAIFARATSLREPRRGRCAGRREQQGGEKRAHGCHARNCRRSAIGWQRPKIR